jgi:hypothetical protein
MPTRTLPLRAQYSAPERLPDGEVDALIRVWLSEVLSPRDGLDGRVYWQVDELLRGSVGG